MFVLPPFFYFLKFFCRAKEALQAQVEPKKLKASTIRHHLGSLKRFMDFLTLKSQVRIGLGVTASKLTEAVRAVQVVNSELSEEVADEQADVLDMYDGKLLNVIWYSLFFAVFC